MLQGLPVSPGIAVGRAVVVRFGGTPAFRRAVPHDEMEGEEKRLRRAARAATEDFLSQSRQSSGAMGSELAAILEAHGMIASDESLLSAVVERMRRDRVNAEWALAAVSREMAERLEASESSAMRERAADVLDVAREIGRQLSGGVPMPRQELPRGSILIADELSPADTARLDPRRVRAIALERGGPTSHASIIARSFGLPAVAGIAGLCDAVSPERPIVVDGDRGIVETSPSKEKIRKSLLRVREARERIRRLRARTAGAAVTADGVRIVLRANLELTEEIPALERWHPEGVGLFRSEFLYLRAAPATPGVEEQRDAYERLLAAVAPYPVVIRTYDLGGEKGIGPAPGDNPALGLRGLRFCLAHPDIFEEQLTALCLASRQGELRILLPMVTGVGELKAARRHLEKVCREVGLAAPPALGVMIEVPSAALLADRLAPEADFFSIGTNDLAQYALAVDRANPDVSALYRTLHPAILRMIRFVVEAGAAFGRPVAVCGEMAADPLGIGALVGLQIREVSVTPVAIPGVKSALSMIHSDRARELAERALNAPDAPDVEKMFRLLQQAEPPASERRTARVEKVEPVR
ncbi:MAG TPA: phosphoenolpyruvate--protein phosphotransferase [Thermoanaerobaculia bacterium]|nr:phosphoenolpyruvate--protein phosphotransferase [Thermoanaerobaculia bacterium]